MPLHRRSKSISTTLSDQELLGEVKKGHDEAAGVLYMRYREALIRLGKSWGLTEEEAEDAVITTLSESLVRNLGKYRAPKGSVRSWIFYNLYRSEVRAIRDRRHPGVPFDDVEYFYRSGQSTEEEAEEIEFWAIYETIMLSISDWDWYEIYRGPDAEEGDSTWPDVVYRYKEALCEHFCGNPKSSATRCFFRITTVTR